MRIARRTAKPATRGLRNLMTRLPMAILAQTEKRSQLQAAACGTKVIMSGVNGNVIMSGCRDDNPDDERREAARDNTKSVSRGADSGGGRDGDRSQRAAVLPDQSSGNQGRSERSGAWESGSTV